MNYLIAYAAAALVTAILFYVLNARDQSDMTDKMLGAAAAMAMAAIWPLTLLGVLIVVVGEAIRSRRRDA